MIWWEWTSKWCTLHEQSNTLYSTEGHQIICFKALFNLWHCNSKIHYNTTKVWTLLKIKGQNDLLSRPHQTNWKLVLHPSFSILFPWPHFFITAKKDRILVFPMARERIVSHRAEKSWPWGDDIEHKSHVAYGGVEGVEWVTLSCELVWKWG